MIDHFVYAAPDLGEVRSKLEQATGVTFAAGGTNPVNGTRNALAPVQGGSYLEVLAVDPEASHGAEREPPFGLAVLREPQLVAWVARVSGIQAIVDRGRIAEVPLGPLVAMSRTRPDGTTLSWEMTYPLTDRGAAVVPLLIDWGNSAPGGIQGGNAELRMETFAATSPAPAELEEWLRVLGVETDVAVRRGERALLELALQGPAGRVTLR